MIGSQIDEYIIDEECGRSAMGRVYRAHSADAPATVVAFKWLRHDKARSAEFEKQFLSQIDLLKRLQYPAIVSVLGAGTYQGTPYFVTDFIEGPTYEAILRQGERPTWRDVLGIALQIVPALRHAHRRSVLHRDLKPGNLFRISNDVCRLADFGVTKFFGDALITHTDNPLGSAAYLSPETAAGKPHSKRSDFYALGALLYTLLVGRPPFTGQTVVELIHKHCFILPERPIHFLKDLPEEFDRFVMRLLAKDPTQRPGSGTLLIHELEALWSALERRGQLGKRPELPATLDKEEDQPLEEKPTVPVRWFEPIPQLPIPWHKRPWIVIPLFLICVWLLIWIFFFRGPSPDELMAGARPLLASDNPADWERAWNDYLEPLSRKYPERFPEEVREARRRLDEQGELRRAINAGKAAHYRSEAERFYHRGLRLSQAGEFAAARSVWQNLIQVFGNSSADEHWARLAETALDRLPTGSGSASPAAFRQTIQTIVAEIRRLREAGKIEDAARLRTALEALYRDDPESKSLQDWLPEK